MSVEHPSIVQMSCTDPIGVRMDRLHPDRVQMFDEDIGSIVLQGWGDVYDYADKIFCYRPTWCWRVRGWRGREALSPPAHPGWCAEGIWVGDENRTYSGMVPCPGFNHHSGLYINLPSEGLRLGYIDWQNPDNEGGPLYGLNVNFEDQLYEGATGGVPVQGLQMVFSIDPRGDEPHPGAATGAIATVWSDVSDKGWISYPCTIKELCSPWCDVPVIPIGEGVDEPPYDPENPYGWAPWCRSDFGSEIKIDLW